MSSRWWKELKPSTVFINTSIVSYSLFKILSLGTRKKSGLLAAVFGSSGSFWKDIWVAPSLEHEWGWWARGDLWQRESLEDERDWWKGQNTANAARPQRGQQEKVFFWCPKESTRRLLRVGKAWRVAVSKIKWMWTCAARRWWAYFHLFEFPKPWLCSKSCCTKTYL